MIGTLVDALPGFAIEGLALGNLRPVITRGELDPVLPRLASALARLEKERPAPAGVFRGERIWQGLRFAAHLDEPVVALPPSEQRAVDGWSEELDRSTWRTLHDLMMAAEERADGNDPGTVDALEDLVPWLASRRVRRTLQSFASYAENDLASLANHRGTRLVIAARRHELATASSLVDPEDLVPELLPTLPRDPFDPEHSFRFDADRRIFWSWGRDRSNDGGTRPGEGGEGSDQVFRLDPP